ncbi:MAG TPA: Flp pilus assembly protein CpaB [Rhizomicrobium sp.]
MNIQRILVLAGAFVAAIVVAFLVSHLLGGGTPVVKAAPPVRIATSEILVAAADLSPGTQLTSSAVRWQEWPRTSVQPGFITQDANPDLDKVVTGAIVRAPLVAGEPLSTSKVVEHAQGAGFMAAVVTPGMRAISIPITTETGAGGFILPNDRVDVLITRQISDTPRRFRARTVLSNVRVLAVDQTYEGKDEKSVLARTATLELSPQQTELLAGAQASGTVALSLRALADGDAAANALEAATKETAHAEEGEVTVIRYGIARSATYGQKE